ncbi:MFS transporter [uncultured Thiothrix sp.]|uniref:MFS transporter n=1 Tax=uncultured Thiothrix sp. TaxID=223185 RepID=UPI00262A5868|nr:MFS transporter [uncultured Thiothrix sp.]
MDSQQTERYYQENPAARYAVLIIVCISSFLTPVSLSGSFVAVPAISEDLHVNAVYASWIPAAFLLSNLLMMLPAGRLADQYGRKRIFLIGGVLFSIGCLIAGFAQSIEVLLFSRVVQGISSAMFFTTGMAIITSVFQQGRGAALGWLVSSIYLGLTCGPLLGGWVTEHFGWQAVFWFPLPLMLIVLLLASLKMKGEWRNAQPERLDFIGTLYMALGMIGTFVGLSTLPDWKSVLWLGLGLSFIVIFVRHCYTAVSPLVRLKLVLGNKPFSRALGASIMVYASNYGLVFLLSLYLQYNRGMTPTEAGQVLMVQAIVMTILAPLAGRLSDRYRPRLLATLGCLSMVAGLALLMVTVGPTTPIWIILICLIAFGIGFGMFSTPNSNSVLGSVPPERLGMSSALLNLSRLLGQMFGTAIITLLMSLMIGQAKITPEHYAGLMEVVRWAVGLSLLFALAAAFLSKERPVIVSA